MIFWVLILFLSVASITGYKNKKILSILIDDPFLICRILTGYVSVYYKKYIKPRGHQCVSELKIIDNHYELNYTFDGKLYTKRFNINTKPTTLNIIKIFTLDDKNEEVDITEKLTPFLGVNKDFHNATPIMLGYSNLHFVTEDIFEDTPTTTKIEKNNPIKLN